MLKFWEDKNLYVKGNLVGRITDAVVHLDDTITFWVRGKKKVYTYNVNNVEATNKCVHVG